MDAESLRFIEPVALSRRRRCCGRRDGEGEKTVDGINAGIGKSAKAGRGERIPLGVSVDATDLAEQKKYGDAAFALPRSYVRSTKREGERAWT